ncbi:MAG: type VII secretion protein EccB [Propionibacteriaceae bacterium]|jgi:type VII secretion protein EccB|nr:type VII secretion protein EccB [Propionibacteriaceae bacterium]
MPSNKDVVEAQRYNRRRLVTAFMSGTPGGRELEPRGFVYPLVIGVVLTAVIAVVGVVMAKFAPTLPEGWEDNKLSVDTDTGARYFTMRGTLYPVSNITSARLMSEPGAFQPVRVGSAVLEGKPRGREIGIPGAPDDIPPVEQLRGDTWISCAGADERDQTWVAASAEGLSATGMAVVANGSQRYLIVGGMKYQINDGDVYRRLFLDSQHAEHEVSAAWLNLFEHGSDLKKIQLADDGRPVAGFPKRLVGLHVGSLVQITDQINSADQFFVVVDDQKMSRLSDFQAQVLELNLDSAAKPVEASSNEIVVGSIEIDENHPALPKDWPAQLPAEEVDLANMPCATLSVSDQVPTVSLAELPPGQVAENTLPVAVSGGYGALIRASSGSIGAVRLVTDSGQAFSLGDDPRDTLGRFGYSEADVVVVPGAWVSLVPAAEVELTNAAARAAAES